MNADKIVKSLVDADTYEKTCVNCAFNPDNGTDMCFAPWTDGTMEDDDIDPCYEGVYRYITGKSVKHLDKLICSGRSGVWIRDKGKEMRCVDERR